MDHDRSISLSPESQRILERLRDQGRFDTVEKCLEDLLHRADRARPKRLKFRVDDRECVFERLSDRQLADLATSAIAFQTPNEIVSYQIGNHNLQLAQAYAVCRSLFGERGRRFDDWKGAFSFPLAIYIEGVNRGPAYAMNLFHYRTHVDFRWLQTVDRDDLRLSTHVLCTHEDPELTTKEFVRIIFHFIGFLEGYAQTFPWSQPFVLSSRSDLVVYGFRPTVGFFNRSFEELDTYEETLRELKNDLPTPGFWNNERTTLEPQRDD